MPKRPRDPNQLAKLIVDIATGEAEDTISDRKKNQKWLRGRPGGLKGGKARASALTEKNRKQIAKKAANARWNKEDKS